MSRGQISIIPHEKEKARDLLRQTTHGDVTGWKNLIFPETTQL